MRKILLTAVLLALTAGTSFAGITNTKHNLSSGSSATVKATNTNQICVFCHTPHNALQNIPLWNRSGARTDLTAYQLYTSSKTLTPTTKGAKLYNDSMSLFCMSCHDGTTAELGTRVNRRSVTSDGLAINVTASWTNGTGSTGPAMLGTSLTNDHPIGFSYGGAVGQDTGGLNTAAAAKTALTNNTKDVFFKANNGVTSDSMECSSCHAVHDNTNAPFLRTTNAGSALCLACHNK